MAVEIFNSSFEKNSNDFSINKILQDYENEVFVNNKNVNILLDNKLDYKSAIKLLNNTEALNLKWLMSLNKNDTN